MAFLMLVRYGLITMFLDFSVAAAIPKNYHLGHDGWRQHAQETRKNMPSPIYLKFIQSIPNWHLSLWSRGHQFTNLTKGPEISYFGDDSPYEKHLWCCEVAMLSMSKELRPEPRWTVQKAHMQQEVNDIDASGFHYFSSGHSKSNAPKTG